MSRLCAAALACLAACSSATATRDAGAVDSGSVDAGPTDAGRVTASNIQHVVIVIQENHSFDSYFGRYCAAPSGSSPGCTSGPACCEAAPPTDPSGSAPVLLDDAENGSADPDHSQACELAEIDDGGMDRYTTGAACSQPANFALASASAAAGYWRWAGQGALADRYFQAVAGASSSNDMYLARAGYVFADNADETASKGSLCAGYTPRVSLTDLTLGDLLNDAGVSWAFYAEGYAAAVAADPACPAAPADCPAQIPRYPCVYDPTDVPFEFYASLADDPRHMRDLAQLATDTQAGQLPAVVFVKGLGYHTEHPGGGTTISAGEQFIQSVLDTVGNSDAGASTLELLTTDESGGFFDHVAPPPPSAVDGQPYGPRIYLIALGPFARAGAISHVPLEHASLVAFVEWNWLGGTGQLGQRDAAVHNLGSLLEPMATGATVP